MDLPGLKKARAPFRRQITKLMKSLQDDLQKDPLDSNKINADYKLLQDYNVKLCNLDEQILAQLTQQQQNDSESEDDDDDDGDENPSEVDKEFDKAFGYQRQVSYLTTLLDAVLTTKEVRPSSPSSSSYSTAVGAAATGRKSNFKLPKIQLRKFSGQLSDWLGWWSQFSKIHDDAEIHAVDKFSYLAQSMVAGTRAKELVESFPMTAENYPEVIQALKDRFGQEDLLIPHYIRGILKLAIENATSKEKTPLSSLYDKLETDIRALGTLEVTTKEMGRFLHPIVEACLSEDLFVAWQRSSLYEKDGTGENPPKSKLDYLLQFLREEAKREMKREQAREDFRWEMKPDVNQNKNKKKRVLNTEDLPTAAGLSSQSVKEKAACIFCGKNNHPSDACFKAKKMTYEDKRSAIIEKNACFICLRTGHRSSKCNVPLACSVCGMKHYEVLCKELAVFKEKKKLDNSNETPYCSETSDTVTGCLGVQCLSDVLLKTLIVKMKNPISGKETIARVVFDDCSQRTYTTKKKLDQISSKFLVKEESRIALIDGSMTKYQPTNHHEIIISGMSKESKPVKIRVRERSRIGCPIPKYPVGPWIEKLKNEKIIVSDIVSNTTHSEIDILIGGDYYESFRTGKRIQVADRLYAVETIFGCTLSGPLPREEGAASSVIQSFFCGEIEKLWNLELLGIHDSAEHETKLEHEEKVKTKFQQQIKQKEDGRFQVRLPFKHDEPTITSNYEVAKKRLLITTKKLETEQLYESYNAIFQDWEREGIIEKVPEKDLKLGFFSPHRPVLKPESETTPIRPVFDASCRVGKKPSLNMLLETGPNMLELIPSLLLKFRRREVGVTADIRKAFLTIEVHEDDRNYQKFLWWNEGRADCVEYRFTRVVFGMTCSPFILAAVLDFHLRRSEKSTAEILRKSFYVDNVVASFNSKDEYEKFKLESTALMTEARMILRQWESNCEQFQGKAETGVLGLLWNKTEDLLSVKKPKMEFHEDDEVTNRKVLSLIAQVFDPVGVVCPSVLLPKLMLQKNVEKKLKWDEPWTPEEKKDFLSWYTELDQLMKIKVPRFAYRLYLNEYDKKEIHLFCDASITSYGCCAYIRTENSDMDVDVQLLMAKSRVAPLQKKNKKITIPRLELLACLIGSRLLSTIEGAMEEETAVYLWSDSSTCIAWITREELWGVFVQNRVREIRNLTKISDWRHIPGNLNPADLPSRGCSPLGLLESRWWAGPSWMKMPIIDRPSSMSIVNEEEIMQEKRKTEMTCLAVERVEPRFSHYLKIVRVAAWMRRFIWNCKVKLTERRLGKFLSIHEIREGEKVLILQIQRRCFVEKPDVKGFNVEKYDDGLWHLKTRLTYKEDTVSFKYPIILPKDEPLVEQLVRYVHETSYHSGTQHVLGKLRERYWIIHGRILVKRVIYKCMRCQRYRIEKLKADPSPLPAKRIDTAVAFQITGIDFAGPLYLKQGRKAWFVLYTCAVYRCVHLDLVESLSTEAFLLSLERFVNTVGRPNTIYTDNGTNFVGARNLMKRLDWDKVTKKTGAMPIEWIFIPPSAPWWGGWWERLVRSVKELLKKMIGRAKMSFEEMRTCLSAVSQVLNDRPLTSVTADPDDLTPLTPSMFMKDLPVSFPEAEEIGAKFFQESYRKIQDVKRSLQARFRKEYLGFLTSRNYLEVGNPPKIGSLVLVGDSNKKRYEWPLGRIQELIPGRDGKPRMAKVKTSSGTLHRALQRLYPLEIMEDSKPPVVELQEKAEKRKVKCVTSYGRDVRQPLRYGQWAGV